MRTRFCLECENFDDRKEIERIVVCDKGHKSGTSCPDFKDRVTDIFYSYIYWASLYRIGKMREAAPAFN